MKSKELTIKFMSHTPEELNIDPYAKLKSCKFCHSIHFKSDTVIWVGRLGMLEITICERCFDHMMSVGETNG